jgi:proteasome accessory factor B
VVPFAPVKGSSAGRKASPKQSLRPDERVLQLLLLLLNAPGPVSRAEIFDAIEAYRTKNRAAGERKFERDKKDLRELGVPIDEPREGANFYEVDPRRYQLAPIDLDGDERVALVLAAEALRRWEGLAYRDVVEDALRKLSFDGGMLAGRQAPAHLAVALPQRGRGLGTRKTMAALSGAVERRKDVTITYGAPDADSTERRVSPYALVYTGGDWQLIGHCHLRDAPRTFRVDRIRRVKVAGKPGTPDFERPAGWAVEGCVQRSPWMFAAGTSGATEVVLEIGPERAWVAYEDFGPDASRESLPSDEGWTRVRFRTGNPDYVVTRVLDGVGHLRLVAPASLRERVRQVAAGVAALYATESAT